MPLSRGKVCRKTRQLKGVRPLLAQATSRDAACTASFSRLRMVKIHYKKGTALDSTFKQHPRIPLRWMISVSSPPSLCLCLSVSLSLCHSFSHARTLWIRVCENVTTRALRFGVFPRRSQLRARICRPDAAGTAVAADLETCHVKFAHESTSTKRYVRTCYGNGTDSLGV